MADEKWMKVPYFGRGKAESLTRALTTGRFADGLDKALFYFSTDTKQWVLVDTDKTIHKITSFEGQPGPSGEGNVKRVDVLPPILEANTETLYIMGTVIYSFDGIAYHPSYENIIGSIPDSKTVVEYVDDSFEAARQYTDEQCSIHIVQGGG